MPFLDSQHLKHRLAWAFPDDPVLGQPDPIAHLLPEAHSIHIIRDGRDVAVSLRGMWFAPGRDMTTLGRYWSERIRHARREAARNLRYLEVRYENLIADPERALREICGFVGLTFDPRMLRYHETVRQRLDEVTTWVGPEGRVTVTKEQRLHNQRFTTRPPAAERVGRWRSELATEERAEFEAAAGDVLDELGYR